MCALEYQLATQLTWIITQQISLKCSQLWPQVVFEKHLIEGTYVCHPRVQAQEEELQVPYWQRWKDSKNKHRAPSRCWFRVWHLCVLAHLILKFWMTSKVHFLCCKLQVVSQTTSGSRTAREVCTDGFNIAPFEFVKCVSKILGNGPKNRSRFIQL